MLRREPRQPLPCDRDTQDVLEAASRARGGKSGRQHVTRKTKRAETEDGKRVFHRSSFYSGPFLRSGCFPTVRCVCGVPKKCAVSLVCFKQVRVSFAVITTSVPTQTPARVCRGLAAATHPRISFFPVFCGRYDKIN